MTSDRPSPMRGVAYRKEDAKSREAARGPHEEAPERYGHVQPVTADQIPGRDDVRDYAAAAGRLAGFRWRVHGELLATSGIREAESLRLTVDDVIRNPDDPYIHVYRQLMEIGKDLSTNGTSLLTEEPPKGGHPRNAWYPRTLIPLLEQLVEEVAALPGPVPVGERPLFYGKNGGLVRPNNWRRRVFNPVATQLGWEQVLGERPDPRTGKSKSFWLWPPHSLRHHAATWMLKDLGLAPALVADCLGHADAAFTQRMYMDRTRTDFGAANLAHETWLVAQDEPAGSGTPSV